MDLGLASLLMLPQPGWMLGLTFILAGLAWWSLVGVLGFEQSSSRACFC
ncbi:hypothetical protein Q427_30855 [Halomonas sp. BC04]|nr:hypothetical protein Q427_30855 [Halomonas sp. BC04]